jgi:parallel beta-helix repeat protein
LAPNETYDGTFDGFDFVSSSGATLENNKAHDNGFDGIYLNDTGSGNTLENDELSSNGEDGIDLDSANNNSLENNKTKSDARDGATRAPRRPATRSRTTRPSRTRWPTVATSPRAPARPVPRTPG